MKTNDIAERLTLYAVPEPNTGCWLWSGASDRYGYGVLQVLGRARSAHRVAWEHHRGPIPPKLCVCHRCDTRACVNPDHLFLGTVADNNSDCARKGRLSMGERHPNARLSDAEVAAIRAADGLHREIAARFGTSRGTVSRIRRGSGRIDPAQYLAANVLVP